MDTRAIDWCRLDDVRLRRMGPDGPYGEPLRLEDVSWLAREEIKEEFMWGRAEGKVCVESIDYVWWLEG